MSRSIETSGDRRLKANYILAIVTFNRQQEEIASVPTSVLIGDKSIELPIISKSAIPHDGRCTNEPSHSSPLEIEVKSDTHNSQLSAPQPPSHRGASIVLLVPLIFALALFLVVKTTITSLAWSIAAASPFITGAGRGASESQQGDSQGRGFANDYFSLPT